MSKAILKSIRPEFVYKILTGEKTVELTKTNLKCESLIDVYIYCTKCKPFLYNYGIFKDEDINFIPNGKVVAKFTLNKIDSITMDEYGVLDESYLNYRNLELLAQSGLSLKEMQNYGKGKTIYAWHIENLQIFNEPRELGEFYSCCGLGDCHGVFDRPCNYNFPECRSKQLTRPPQNYLFMEI